MGGRPQRWSQAETSQVAAAAAGGEAFVAATTEWAWPLWCKETLVVAAGWEASLATVAGRGLGRGGVATVGKAVAREEGAFAGILLVQACHCGELS